ncbi:MAG TPA: hypothetical protein VHP13_09480 [Gammaproteobacteria bacterium]|jgi:hypothetical protein|nr:hypothetical protein [Gammaproteobacteria bacterium]
MTKFALACGLALSLGIVACASNPETPAPAADTSATPAPAAGSAAEAPKTAAKPKLVCEESKPLGSLLPQRICMTPEEAAARKRASQDAMRNIQNQSSVGPGMGSSSGG